MKLPNTLQEAITYFADPDRAFEYAKQLRWSDGKVVCPRCGSEKNSFVKTRRLWFCYGCKKQFTVKVKTIFEDSALGLDKWMTAVWMLSNCKNGISSHELARALGITQKSAWFMLHRIREALKEPTFGSGKLGGEGSELETDETFIGGRVQNMHKDRKLRYQQSGGRDGGKTVVQGILDRDLRKVRATVVPDVKRETLQNAILRNIKYGSTVYTDDAVGYERLNWHFVHDVVNKTEAYVRGRVHVNGMENFWSLLKRGLKGTYVCVEPFHLSRYVDEQAFRFNHRKREDRTKMTDGERFTQAMRLIVGRRLTYSDLTGKSDSPHHAATETGTAEPF
ncbi:MAG TPA: IS1595 family transposase [Candidatus Binatia bacterium]|nr:IS1595 family transposase [Candidatus Binatia bacterium]